MTVLVVMVTVFLAYNANQGLPFVPTKQLKVDFADGSNLVITRTQDMQGTAVEIKNTISLDAKGNLWYETTRPGQDGAPMTTKAQYTKGIPVKKDGN